MKRLFHSNTIRGRLTLAQMLAGVVAIAVAAVTLSLLLVSSYLGNITRSLSHEAVLLRQIAQTEGPEAAAAMGAAHLGARVTIVAPDGRVVADSDGDPAQMENHTNRPELGPILRGEEALSSSRRFSHTVGSSKLYVAVAMAGGGALRLGLPLEELYRAIALQVGLVVLVLAVAGGLAALVGARLFDSISRPVEEMTAAAKQMAGGQMQVRVEQAGPVELEHLAYALNQLAENLEHRLLELETGQERLAAVVGHMQSGVILVDGAGAMRVLNPAACTMLGLTEQDLGAPFDQVIPSLTLVQAIRDARTGRPSADLELELGGPRALSLVANAVPMHTGTGGAMLVLHNVSAVRRLDQMRRDFVANVSHELKTPLTSVQGFAETLLAGALDEPDTARRFVTIIREESARMANLVKDLLTLARLEGDPQALSLRPTNLVAILQQALHRMEPAAANAGIHLQPLEGAQHLHVLADPGQLEQVAVNLLENALKYSSAGGHVSLAVSRQGNEALVTVTDTGYGIPPEALPRLFERFYRVDKGRSRKAGGTGLGLAIVRHIVEAHGGRVWAESTLGSGSQFCLTIPLAEA